MALELSLPLGQLETVAAVGEQRRGGRCHSAWRGRKRVLEEGEFLLVDFKKSLALLPLPGLKLRYDHATASSLDPLLGRLRKKRLLPSGRGTFAWTET